MKISFDLIQKQEGGYYHDSDQFWTVFVDFRDYCLHELQHQHLFGDKVAMQPKIFKEWSKVGNEKLHTLTGETRILFKELLRNIKKIEGIFPLNGLTESTLNGGFEEEFETAEEEQTAIDGLYSSDTYEGLINLFNFYQSIHDLYETGVNNSHKTLVYMNDENQKR